MRCGAESLRLWGQVYSLLVCFSLFCLVFHLSVMKASGSEPQSHIFKYSWDLIVHCICITYLHCIFVQLGGWTVISQCLKWQLIKFNYDLVTLPDFPARGNKKFVMFYWNHKWPFHLIDFTWVEIPSVFIKLKVTNVMHDVLKTQTPKWSTVSL